MTMITHEDRQAFSSMTTSLRHERDAVASRYCDAHLARMMVAWSNACLVESVIIASESMNDAEVLAWVLFATSERLQQIRRARRQMDRGASAVSNGEAPPMAKTATAVKAKPKPKLAKKAAVPAKRTKRGR